MRATLIRWLLVFACAWLVLAVLAGPRLTRPSYNNHYVHLANAWLEGRLDHGARPPGYCEDGERRRGDCRGHTFDDWAVVWTLELAEGGTLRGYPCKMASCRRDARQGVETWWVLGEGWRRIPRGAIAARHDTWYVSFPPGPALVFLPWVMLWGTRVWDVLVSLTLAAWIPVVIVATLDRVRGRENGRGAEHLWVAAAWTWGSSACELAALGEVWFTAQLCGALALFSFLRATLIGAPVQAGTWLLLAVACRPHLACAAIVYFAMWGKGPRDKVDLLRFMLPLAFGGALLALHNVVRFEDPFEFGHRFLEIRWQARMQESGMFSSAYLLRNLQCLVTLLPLWRDGFPFLHVSTHGMALWASTPWILFVFGLKRSVRAHWGLVLGAIGTAMIPLFYQNSGQVQFSYRFALDWLPFIVLLLACSGRAGARSFRALVVVACVVHVVAAHAWVRMPTRLFVTDPPGWPFAHELDDLREP